MCNTLAYCQSISQNQPQESCATHWLTVRVSAKTSPKSHVQHIGLLSEYQPKPAPRVMCNTLAYCQSIGQNQPQESCATHWLTVRVSAKTSPKSHVQHIGLLCNTLAYCVTHWLTVRVSAKTSPKNHVQNIGLLCNTLAYCVTHWLTV